MQIDDKNYLLWDNQECGRILLNPKNINLSMLQNAIKIALLKNKENILFQAGDANEKTQGVLNKIKEVPIDKNNYLFHEKAYHKKIKEFESAKVGDIVGVSDDGLKQLVVIENDQNSQKIWFQDIAQKAPNAGILHIMLYSKESNKKIKRLIKNSYFHWVNKDYKNLISCLDELFNKRENSHEFNDKENFIKNLFYEDNFNKKPCSRTGGAVPERINYYMGKMEAFLKKYNYENLFLTNNPHIKKYECGGTNLYLNLKQKATIKTYNKNDIPKPCMGKNYYVINHKTQYLNIQHCKIYNWYERKIPEILKKLKLSYKKIKIHSQDKEYHAWKITGGLAQFKNRPIIMF